MKAFFMAVLTVITTAAMAAPEADQLRRLSGRVAQVLDRHADRLTPTEQRMVNDRLQDVLRIVRYVDERPGEPGLYMARTELGPLSRRPGGEYMYAVLRRPVTLESLVISPYGSQVRIYEAVALTENNTVYRIREVVNEGIIRDRDRVYADFSYLRGQRVKELRFRVESWRDAAFLEIQVESPNREVQFIGR